MRPRSDALPARELPAGSKLPPLNLIGESPPFRSAVELIHRLAACDATVLITGETGTGKEVAARAIHYLSMRREQPFVPINCGAIPETLIETELFGHARGAFTDAREARHGFVGQAEGGTLFLDEIETISERGQVALLRFLQDREYRPVGGVIARGADVRVVAASNVGLGDLAARGRLRQDLLFRLNVLALELPPLRDRGDDVLLFAHEFVRRFCHQYRKPARSIAPDAIAALRAHPWPGNVRELENMIHRAVVLEDGAMLALGGLRSATKGGGGSGSAMAPLMKRFRDAKADAIADFERSYISQLLTRSHGNISLAARLSGKDRSRLSKLVRKYGLHRVVFSRTATAP
jgi:DNA-binding NtrC family response regulator